MLFRSPAEDGDAVLHQCQCHGILPAAQETLGAVDGVQRPKKIAGFRAAHIEPKIYPDVSAVAIKGRHCIRVAFSGSESPYYAHGRAYMRVADEDRQLSARELEALILRKHRTREGWDSQPITDPTFQVGIQRLRAFVRLAGLEWSDAPTVLENLGLRASQGTSPGWRLP